MPGKGSFWGTRVGGGGLGAPEVKLGDRSASRPPAESFLLPASASQGPLRQWPGNVATPEAKRARASSPTLRKGATRTAAAPIPGLAEADPADFTEVSLPPSLPAPQRKQSSRLQPMRTLPHRTQGRLLPSRPAQIGLRKLRLAKAVHESHNTGGGGGRREEDSYPRTVCLNT